MFFLDQTNFPGLWLAFQKIFGGTKDKQRLAISHYSGQKKILEIGCSVGNVSDVFSSLKGIEFTGIDIDTNAIAYARKRFSLVKKMKFETISLADLAKRGDKFEYILFANILHHVDDHTATNLFKDVQKVLTKDSTLVIMEPEKRRDDYGILFKLFYMLEKGKFRRHKQELVQLVRSAGLPIIESSEILVSPDSLPFLKVGRIIQIRASLQEVIECRN